VIEPVEIASDDGGGSGRGDRGYQNEGDGEGHYEGEGDYEGEGELAPPPELPPLEGEDEGAFLQKILGGFAYAQSNSMGSMLIRSIDRREDRVIIYTSLNADLVEYVYKLKAVSIGKYTVPPAFGEGMYDRATYYRGVAGKIEIKAK
jgi:hypothetical protein